MNSTGCSSEVERERAEASEAELDRRVIRGSGWVAVSYGGRNFISLLSMLVLVRLLEPDAFGLVALAFTFLIVLTEIQGAGISTALIYTRENVDTAAATAAVFAPISAVLLFGIGFVVAPALASIFHTEDLTDVFRVMSLMLVLQALGGVPGSILERNLDFRSKAKSELSAAVVLLGVSVGTALAGWGVWSLVAGQLAGAATQAAVNWIVVPWRPNPRLARFSVLRDLVRYGRFVTGTNLLNLANNTLDNLMIGRLLGASALGFYAITFRVADFPNSVIGYIVGRVMFPVYSILQHDLAAFRRAYVQNLQRIVLFALPVSVGLAIVAEPIVLVLLGDKWERVIVPLRVLAVYGLVKSLTAPAGEVFKGAGRPSLGVVFGAMQIAVIVPALLLLIPRFHLVGAAYAMLVGVAVAGIPKLVVSMRLVRLSARDLGTALAPSVLCSALLACALALLLLPSRSMSPALALILLVSSGIVVYMAATLVFARGIVMPVWVNLRGAR